MAAETNEAIVADHMTQDPIVIGPNDPIGRARNMLLGVGVHALPVLDGATLVGIVTSVDLADSWADDRSVADVMTPAPLRVDVNATIVEAAQMMIEYETHHLVVDRRGQMVGILSTFDLIRAFVEAND